MTRKRGTARAAKRAERGDFLEVGEGGMPGNNFILSGEQKDPIGRRFPDTLTCGRYLHSTPVDPADNNFRPSEVPKNLAVVEFSYPAHMGGFSKVLSTYLSVQIQPLLS